jgi:Bacteriophage tail sheath protein
MPEYLAPGVYVEEIANGPRPIEGVATGTTGFVGPAERGPLAPRLVTSWRDFASWFGELPDGASFLPFAARGFFDDGGQRLSVARVTRADAATATLVLPTTDPAQTLSVAASGPGVFGNHIRARMRAGTNDALHVTFLYYRAALAIFVDPTDPANATDPNRREPDAIEEYRGFGTDRAGAEEMIRRVNEGSRLVTLAWSDAARAPAPPSACGFRPLAGGTDGRAPITAARFAGTFASDPGEPQGLAGLARVDDIVVVCIPDEVNEALFRARPSATPCATRSSITASRRVTASPS